MAGEVFFIWIRRNPLKSPESAKEIQAFFLGFLWISLLLFGANSPRGCATPGQTAHSSGYVWRNSLAT
jgi:hypothetical protein